MLNLDLRRILMVEDDPDIQTVAQFALQAIGGFQVQVCGDGRTALEQSRSFSPDLILLDVMMPDMDGPTVLKRLRANPCTDHIPVVFMTAKVQPNEITQFLRLGVLDVIAKPFDPMTLAHLLTKIWERAHVVKAH